MDNILSLLTALLYWRILLPTLTGIACSLVLTRNVDWFDGRYGLLIIIFSLLFGIFWQEKVDNSRSLFERIGSTSGSISNIGLLFIWVVLFGILYAFLSSSIAAFIITTFSILVIKFFNSSHKASKS